MKSKTKSTNSMYKSSFDSAIKLYRSGDSARAVESLRLLAIDFPNVTSIHAYLGLVLLELSNAIQAARHFDVATHLSPGDETVSLGLFHSLLESGRRKEAVVELRRFQSVSHSDDYDAIADDMGIRLPTAA